MKAKKYYIDISKIEDQKIDLIAFKNFMVKKGFSINCEIKPMDRQLKNSGTITRDLTTELVIEVLENSKEIIESIDNLVAHVIEFYVLMQYVIKKIKSKKISNDKAELENE